MQYYWTEQLENTSGGSPIIAFMIFPVLMQSLLEPSWYIPRLCPIS